MVENISLNLRCGAWGISLPWEFLNTASPCVVFVYMFAVAICPKKPQSESFIFSGGMYIQPSKHSQKYSKKQNPKSTITIIREKEITNDRIKFVRTAKIGRIRSNGEIKGMIKE